MIQKNNARLQSSSWEFRISMFKYRASYFNKFPTKSTAWDKCYFRAKSWAMNMKRSCNQFIFWKIM